MNYADIILDNSNNHCDIQWWPKFAYHCTDIKNAVSILDKGTLYCRADASRLKQMHNDNASKHVIDMTQAETVSSVRFYYRPKTPTQYYNEGYKHPELRYDNDENANMPVPVFFLFDLEKMLLLPETQFAEQSQSGYGSKLQKGVQAFSSLDFDKIYSNDLSRVSELKKYIQAEILYPNYLSMNYHT